MRSVSLRLVGTRTQLFSVAAYHCPAPHELCRVCDSRKGEYYSAEEEMIPFKGQERRVSKARAICTLLGQMPGTSITKTK